MRLDEGAGIRTSVMSLPHGRRSSPMTGVCPDDRIACALAEVFNFQPRELISALGLRAPIYTPTAAYGHFGRNPESAAGPSGSPVSLFPWERTDRVDDLKTAAGL